MIHLIPRPNQDYTIVYINTCAEKDAYKDFFTALDLLPIEYFRHLEGFYVLHPSFMNKAMGWFSFNAVTNFVKNKTEYFS